MLMSARNAWRQHVEEQCFEYGSQRRLEKNLNLSVQDNDHHHRREGKLSQSEIDRMVQEVENYRDEDEANKLNIVTKSGM